ncbi:uncharacterized protein [Aegilops tauschii subsp. strangulata]|uniref:uncharacterized protein n=1 Tax=Aegilops tauschii subsp. strangulata TaxID=200361 RepID=UPI000989C6AA|nr:uncharacterized protein LOC109759743 [Aegilops tauschii subsp. strangulata]
MEVLVIIPDWTVPYIAYLLRQELPEDEDEDEDEARQIVRGSKAFTVINGQLYRESVTGVAEHCISPEEGRLILNEIHSGTCGHHASSRTIVTKAYRAGFYWPHANEMAKDIVDKCEGCQFYSNMSHKELIFRVPHSIITDNGSNFDSDEFRAFSASQGTRVNYTSVAHPQSNGQAERANGLILQGLKPQLMHGLKHAARAWVTELPSVLWGLRTTPNWSTDRTPFFMVYGAETVLPSDLLHNAPPPSGALLKS